MPYTAITPFRTAVQRLLDNPQPRPDGPAPDTYIDFRYQGETTKTNGSGNETPTPPSHQLDYTIAEFTYEGGFVVNWRDPRIEALDYQGGDANNPAAKFDPKEKFISVTELPDGVQGNYLSGRPRGRLEVTEQVDIFHPWRVAVDDLADYICHRLDGRSIQLIDDAGNILPGIGTIRVGVRSVVQEASSRMWRLSQRFVVSGHD